VCALLHDEVATGLSVRGVGEDVKASLSENVSGFAFADFALVAGVASSAHLESPSCADSMTRKMFQSGYFHVLPQTPRKQNMSPFW
jgi:hypothetical protein